MTQQHKEKIGKANSVNMRRLWDDPVYRANQIAKRKGIMPKNLDALRSKEARSKMSKTHFRLYKEGRIPTNFIHGKSNSSEYRVSYENARRVRKMEAEGSHTIDQWEVLKKSANFKCAGCNKRKFLTRDHIRPLSKGGSDFIENIQPLCVSCNSKKSNNWVD